MKESFQRVIDSFLRMGAERVLIVTGADFDVRASHGMDPRHRWSEQVSLGLLERCFREGTPLFLSDAQKEFEDRWSLAASDIRSVICVPFWAPDNQVAGLLYADVRARRGAFASHVRTTAQDCARQIESLLFGVSPSREGDGRGWAPQVSPSREGDGRGWAPAHERSPVIRGSLGLKPRQQQAPSRPVSASPAKAVPGTAQADSREVSIFYRSMAAMVGVGLPLGRALSVLSEHGDAPHMQQVAGKLIERIDGGCSLSQAMQNFPLIFPRSDLQMIRAGEASGQLHRVVADLADFRERGYQMSLKVRQALTYPAVISLISLSLVVLGPPYLLQGQFQLIRDSGQQPPLITQILMSISDGLRVAGLPLLVMGGLALAGGIRLWKSRPAWQEAFWRQAMRLPVLSGLLQRLATARFAACLSQTYRVGLPIQECLRLSVMSAENPVLADGLQRLLQEMTSGCPLHQALASLDFFPGAFLQMVEAGEEAGKVDDLMGWVARLYERDVEYALASFVSLIEPLLLMTMGIVVGLILIATLMPMLGVLQGL